MKIAQQQHDFRRKDDPKETSEDKGSGYGANYGLTRTDVDSLPKEEVPPIRTSWAEAQAQGSPLYIADSQGKLFGVVPEDVTGSIYLHEIIPRYEYTSKFNRYEGQNAWEQVDQAVGVYRVVPLSSGVSASSVEAHYAAARDPIWLNVVQNMIHAHEKLERNPYKK